VTFVSSVDPKTGTFAATGGNQAGGRLTTSRYPESDYEFRHPDVKVAAADVTKFTRAAQGDKVSAAEMSKTPEGRDALAQARNQNLDIRTAVRWLMSRNPNMRPEDVAGALFGNKSFLEVMNKDSQLQLQYLKAESQQRHQAEMEREAGVRADIAQRREAETERYHSESETRKQTAMEHSIDYRERQLQEKQREFDEKQKAGASKEEMDRTQKDLERLRKQQDDAIREYDRILGISGSTAQTKDVRDKAAAEAEARKPAAVRAREQQGRGAGDTSKPPAAAPALKPLSTAQKDKVKAALAKAADDDERQQILQQLKDGGFDTTGF
jgi:hypothetical protein